MNHNFSLRKATPSWQIISIGTMKKYSVKEISTMLNFSGPASFGKYFKASQGCPPGDYLRSISEKH